MRSSASRALHSGEPGWLKRLQLTKWRGKGGQYDYYVIERSITAYTSEREAAQARKKAEKIEGKRRQLVSDHLARPKAIPLDVLEEKQEELDAALAAARQQLAQAEAEIETSVEGLQLARQLLLTHQPPTNGSTSRSGNASTRRSSSSSSSCPTGSREPS